MSTHPSADAEPGDVNAIDPELNPESPQLGESPLSLPNDLQQQRDEIELRQNEETHALEIELMQLEIEEKRLEIEEMQIQLARQQEELARQQEDNRLDLKYRQETELDRYYEARRVQNQRIRVQMVEFYARLIMGFSAFSLGAYLTFSGNLFGSLLLGGGFASVRIQLAQATKLTHIVNDKTLSTADQEDSDES